jgi:hypothetical protein
MGFWEFVARRQAEEEKGRDGKLLGRVAVPSVVGEDPIRKEEETEQKETEPEPRQEKIHASACFPYQNPGKANRVTEGGGKLVRN